MLEVEEKESEILSGYLPKQLGEEETKKICEICKRELKKEKEKEEYLDVDNADREEFSNKWNLPRNSP